MEDAELAVAGVETVGPDTVAVTFESPPDFEARPGQFVKLTLPVDGEDVSRFYTISSPDVEGTFEITVAVDPEGDVGPLLAELAADETVSVSGPFGSDFYEGEDPVVVLAGGPGIGPAVAIAERARDDDHGAAVVYRDAEPIHEERIKRLRGRGATVAVIDANEELTTAVASVLDEYGHDSQLFVYGFADFIDDATGAIEAADGDTSSAKIENFG
jgi:3-phenylpropionate/trans-cinnamate dioxygenase ferredoxin reductase subunit